MELRHPRSTRPDTFFPYTSLFRSFQPVAATDDCRFRIADDYRRATVGVRYDQLVALETDPADVAIVRQGLHFPRRDVDGLRHLRRMNAFVAVFDGPAAGQRVRAASDARLRNKASIRRLLPSPLLARRWRHIDRAVRERVV